MDDGSDATVHLLHPRQLAETMATMFVYVETTFLDTHQVNGGIFNTTFTFRELQPSNSVPMQEYNK